MAAWSGDRACSSGSNASCKITDTWTLIYRGQGHGDGSGDGCRGALSNHMSRQPCDVSEALRLHLQ